MTSLGLKRLLTSIPLYDLYYAIGPIAVSMSFTSYDYLKIFFDKVFQVEVLHSGHSR